MIDFNKRFVEVDEILNYLSKDDYNKIPSDVIKYIKSIKIRHTLGNMIHQKN